jgi:hypothetical protein
VRPQYVKRRIAAFDMRKCAQAEKKRRRHSVSEISSVSGMDESA